MRRFDTPPGPPGWAGLGAELLRVVDPTGRAIAWLAPGLGGNCVGYAARREGDTTGGWQQILRVGSPRDLRADPLGYGCAILGPGTDGEHQAHRATWQFVERDPTTAICAVRCGPEWANDPFAVRLALTARLENAALHLELVATNESKETVLVAPGLRLCFAESFRSQERKSATDQVNMLRSDDGPIWLTVSPDAGAFGQIVRVADGCYEARTPGTTLTPGAQITIAVVLGVSWEDS